MTTDVAVRDEPMTAETLRYTAPPGQTVDLIKWVANLKAAEEISTALCRTDFVPTHFRNNIPAATAAVLYGAGLGMDPLAAWQAIYVVHGRVGMYAKSMVAVLQAAGHDVWTESQSDQSVTVCARRKEWPAERFNRCTWDVPRAMKAELYKNDKYKTNTQQMLYARAASEVCRQTAADALHGMAYSVEEIEDMEPVAVTATIAPVALADITGVPAAVEGPRATRDQVDAIADLCGRLGTAGPRGCLDTVAEILGRPVGSSRDVSEVEAQQVLQVLAERLAVKVRQPEPEDVPDPEPVPAEDVSQDEEWPEVTVLGGVRDAVG